MNLIVFGLLLSLVLRSGQSKGFLSKFLNDGKDRKDKGSNYVDVCETVRIMPRIAFAVVGGAPLKVDNSAPYIVAVGERTPNGSVSWFCGGSLISPSHILTAAHCLVSRNVSTVRVGSFSTKKNSFENDYEVADTIIHPEYKITQSYNDIGILKVKNAIDFDGNIKPVCLPANSDSHEKEKAKVVGWGAEEFGGEGTDKLQQVEVEVFSNAECEKAYRNSTIGPKTFPVGITSGQLCAGSKKGGKDACQGDSGGPLVLTDQQGIVRQIGIVSTGAGCGFKMFPGVYTRVSSYTDWIRTQMKKSDAADSSRGNGSSSAEVPKNSQRSNTKETGNKPRGQGSLVGAEYSCDSKDGQRKPNQSKITEKSHDSRNQSRNAVETSSGRGII